MKTIVFVGPSLPEAEARRLVRCQTRPPAQQGDIWKAMVERPRVIVLLDGVFESARSVWHRELLAALDAGIAVFGASSMGALRSVELAPYGMVGIGQIFRWYRDGVLVDDAEVALLHASAEHAHRPLTVPLVNVRHVAAQARAERILSKKEAEALVESASRVFYQERRWASLVREQRWSESTRQRWTEWFRANAEDLKARDARECLLAVADFLRGPLAQPMPSGVRPPSHARVRKLLQQEEGLAGALRSPRGRRESEEGLRSLLLAGWARSMGLSVTAQELGRVRVGDRKLDAQEEQRLRETLALEEKVLRHAARLLPDGPSELEGLALARRRK
jgi:hypothetical protein